MTPNTQPVNKTEMNDAQSDEAKKAMDGIKPTDINQDKVSQPKQESTDDTYIDMVSDAKQPE